jgi:wobble nucleotide-excising tRNase
MIKKIKTEAIGADKLNKYLKQFFSSDKLKIKLTDNGRYKLYRNDQLAKNLSTGEKNIISLVYFFTKLEETKFNLNNAIIFIDDPVSSLDSNHIFKIYAFIIEKLKNCRQLFITTHNFDFFNLLKKDIKDKNEERLKDLCKFYIIKKIINQNSEYSIIEDLPNVLQNYKSEYNYLFKVIKDFYDSVNKVNYDLIYLLPNILRRFFEAYLFLKYPDGESFKTKANNFLQEEDFSTRQSVLKLMDEYSHEQNPEHSLKFPDIEEVITAVSFILETIKNKDKVHYEALCRSL